MQPKANTHRADGTTRRPDSLCEKQVRNHEVIRENKLKLDLGDGFYFTRDQSFGLRRHFWRTCLRHHTLSPSTRGFIDDCTLHVKEVHKTYLSIESPGRGRKRHSSYYCAVLCWTLLTLVHSFHPFSPRSHYKRHIALYMATRRPRPRPRNVLISSHQSETSQP